MLVPSCLRVCLGDTNFQHFEDLSRSSHIRQPRVSSGSRDDGRNKNLDTSGAEGSECPISMAGVREPAGAGPLPEGGQDGGRVGRPRESHSGWKAVGARQMWGCAFTDPMPATRHSQPPSPAPETSTPHMLRTRCPHFSSKRGSAKSNVPANYVLKESSRFTRVAIVLLAVFLSTRNRTFWHVLRCRPASGNHAREPSDWLQVTGKCPVS